MGTGIIPRVGVAKGIEEKLEGLVEGFFARVFRSGLQPIEVGRRILKEMADGVTVSINKTYAPNEFKVLMGPEDHVRFQQMEAGLRQEFSDIVIEQAKQERWNLMGLPRVTFELTEGMGRGQFKLQAALAADDPKSVERVTTHHPDAQGGGTGAVPVQTADKLGLATTGAELTVLDRSGHPAERISITRSPVVIGRMSTCDIVLSDPNVSRRHAELRRDEGVWTLVDLGSTNGSMVNGSPVKDQVLEDRDRLGFGSTDLVFRTTAA